MRTEVAYFYAWKFLRKWDVLKSTQYQAVPPQWLGKAIYYLGF